MIFFGSAYLCETLLPERSHDTLVCPSFFSVLTRCCSPTSRWCPLPPSSMLYIEEILRLLLYWKKHTTTSKCKTSELREGCFEWVAGEWYSNIQHVPVQDCLFGHRLFSCSQRPAIYTLWIVWCMSVTWHWTL